MQKAMNEKMEKQEFKDKYAKRSSVEGPFGILKEQFNIEKEVVIGMIKTEERPNLDAIAYNLIQLYNIIQEIKNSKEDLENFCERESVVHQLKLNVIIFKVNLIICQKSILVDTLYLEKKYCLPKLIGRHTTNKKNYYSFLIIIAYSSQLGHLISEFCPILSSSSS